MKYPTLLYLLILINLISCTNNSVNEPEAVNYIPQIPDSIYSINVNDAFKLIIRLPANYNHTKPEGYDVLYILDGDWFTFGSPGYLDNVGGIGGVVGYADSLRRQNLMPDFITVGIGYPNENHRHRDYLYPFDSINTNSGGGEKFYQFLKNELLPLIDYTFNTKGPNGRTLIGHSASAYFTMYAFFRYNENDGMVFKNFLASSPNIYYHDFYLIDLAEMCDSQNVNPIPTKLFWSHGDGKFEMLPPTIERLRLPVEGLNRFNFKLQIFPGENHTWVVKKSFYEGLKWIFCDE